MSLVSSSPNPPSAGSYIYQALGKYQIRLLALAPGEESDDIHIRLTHVDLEKDPHVDYEALSYAWGTSEPTQRVVVDADDGSSPSMIPIRDNLAHALRRIRDTMTTRILWIDALCLNQEDDKEKSHQVPFMAEIYRRAACVIVWLGPEHDGSTSAMEILRDLGENLTMDWETTVIKYSDSFGDKLNILRNSASLKTSIARLVERDWFQRIWVLQEVFLSRRCSVFCGPSQVKYDTFMRGALYGGIFSRSPHPDMLLGFMWRRPITLGILNRVASGKKCTDPRDRIYGVLAILEENEEHPLHVDYSLSVPEVYTAATKHFVQTQESLSMLDSCGLTSKPMDNLPSWVPDFSNASTGASFSDVAALAASLTRPFVNFPETGIMRLAGVMSSKVQSVEPLGRTIDEATGAILRFMRMISPEEMYVDGNQSFGDALFCALIGGLLRHAGFPSDTPELSREECRSAVRYITSLAKGTKPDSVAGAVYLKQMNYIDALWRGNALFLTENGYIGLGAPTPTNADNLFFPLGSKSPLLIRLNGGSQKTECFVVGTCYVTGLMAGEILYGPLPSNYCLLYDHYFLTGMRTTEFHWMDSDGEPSGDCDREFEKERARKAFGVEDERLLTPELLRSKGVPVEWIDLV